MTDGATQFIAATIRTATPLFLAASGELLVERAGLINIGLEGAILAGAFGSLVGATAGGVMWGYIGACLAGLLVSAVFALFVIGLRSDQIISGMAVTLLSVGVTGSMYRTMFGTTGAALNVPTSAPHAVPWLVSVPVLGRALFNQPGITYLAYLWVPILTFWLNRTHGGLSLRAIGEKPEAATAAGVRVRLHRALALLVGGMLGGLAGGMLVLAQAGTFAEGMSAGRGFIAIGIVVLGRWNPLGVAAAAVLFGAASALQYLFQAMGWNAPYQLFLMIPYVLTLAALAGAVGRARAPAALGKAV